MQKKTKQSRNRIQLQWQQKSFCAIGISFSNGSVQLKKSWVMLRATIGSHNCLCILAALLAGSSWRSIIEFATMQRRRSDQTPVPLLYYNQSSHFLFCHSSRFVFVVLLINGTFSSWLCVKNDNFLFGRAFFYLHIFQIKKIHFAENY